MATWQQPGRRHRLVVPLTVLVAVGIEAAVIGSQMGNGASFDHIRWSWLAIAGAAEVVSVLSLGALYRPLLRAGGVAVPPGHALALGSAASAITATVPAGTAIASGYLFKQFRRGGSSPGLAGWAVSVAAALSLVGFATVVVAGSSIGTGDPLGSLWRVGGIGLALAVLFIAASTMLLRRPAALRRLLAPAYRHFPSRRTDRAAREAKLTALVEQLTALRPSVRILVSAFAFAVLTWASDLAVFLLSLHAVGLGSVAFDSAVVAYAAGLATVSITIIPAGIGTVEAGMLLALTSAGAKGPIALAGVVLYRVIAYVLVAAAGWLVWATLRRHDRTRRQASRSSDPLSVS
jgi:putative heme transporter